MIKRKADKTAENYKEWFCLMAEKGCVSTEKLPLIIDCYEKNAALLHKLCRKCKRKNSIVKIGRANIKKRDTGYLLNLVMVLMLSKKTFEEYKKANISEDIFFHTMSDIKIWSENCEIDFGVFGVENMQWLRYHINMDIFRLGRLQFQKNLMSYPLYADKKKRQQVNLKIGEKVLYVHIPRGEKLDMTECEKSFKAAESFFESFYPYKGYMCESWLLYEGNSAFMKKDSNIIRFADFFNILGSKDKDEDTIKYLFGKRQTDPQLYPENSSLQKSCKEHILSGGKLGLGFGVIER